MLCIMSGWCFPGCYLPEWRVLINLVGQNGWPEHLEEVLTAIQLSAKLHPHQVVGDLLDN